MTTRPRRMRSRSSIARCSLVWGMTLSSAATISSARSMAPTPASIFLMNRSCPGTSTMLTSRPLGSVIQANPKSTVISRSFSSGSRSGSMSVRALTRVDLPWSTWPAVPITYIVVQTLAPIFRGCRRNDTTLHRALPLQRELRYKGSYRCGEAYAEMIWKWASVGTQSTPLMGTMSCGQAENATMQSISARSVT